MHWLSILSLLCISFVAGERVCLITRQQWEEFFPERWGVGQNWKQDYRNKPFFKPEMETDFYSFDNLKRAFKKLNKVTHPVDYRTFLNEPGYTNDDKKRELCAFLANIAHETGRGDWGLYYREEIAYESGQSSGHYVDNRQLYYNVSYHGRGPIQLSWFYNYKPYSAVYFGDDLVLQRNPELLLADGATALGSAIWFWMTPDPGHRKSPHQVIYPKSGEGWGFGYTILSINGGLEGDARENGTSYKDQTVTRRLRNYRKFARLLNVPIDVQGEKMDTQGKWSTYA